MINNSDNTELTELERARAEGIVMALAMVAEANAKGIGIFKHTAPASIPPGVADGMVNLISGIVDASIQRVEQRTGITRQSSCRIDAPGAGGTGITLKLDPVKFREFIRGSVTIEQVVKEG